MEKYYGKLKIATLAGIGATVCISLLAYFSSQTEVLLLMAPFGATMVILFGLPESPLAQPKNIVLGHLITVAVGMIILYSLGVNAFSLGIAVGLSILLMLLTNTTHPPAGANPLVVMLAGEDWSFMMMPVAFGAFVIVLFGWLYHKYVSQRQYPAKWF